MPAGLISKVGSAIKTFGAKVVKKGRENKAKTGSVFGKVGNAVKTLIPFGKQKFEDKFGKQTNVPEPITDKTGGFMDRVKDFFMSAIWRVNEKFSLRTWHIAAVGALIGVIYKIKNGSTNRYY